MTTHYTSTITGAIATLTTPRGKIEAYIHRPTGPLPWVLIYGICTDDFEHLTDKTLEAPSLGYIKNIISEHDRKGMGGLV